jgi:hypothetical protein
MIMNSVRVRLTPTIQKIRKRFRFIDLFYFCWAMMIEEENSDVNSNKFRDWWILLFPTIPNEIIVLIINLSYATWRPPSSLHQNQGIQSFQVNTFSFQ